jgi:hypothetical protein
MLGATYRDAVLYITTDKWTTLGQDTGICVGRPKLLYSANCDYTKMLDFSLVLNMLLNRLSSKCTVSLQLLVSVKPKLTFWELSTDRTKEMYKNVYCAVFWYSY